MKKLIFISLLSLSAHASKPVIGLNDLAYSKGTGVDKVQFLVGGPEEKITGAVNHEAIKKVFRTSMLGAYRCFSQVYGPDSDKTGRMLIEVTLKSGSHPAAVEIQSADFDSQEFLSCLQAHWNKVKIAAPADGKAATVVMPILARLRSP